MKSLSKILRGIIYNPHSSPGRNPVNSHPNPPMNLYKISQTSNCNYDTYDAAIVCAENEAAARVIHPSGDEEDLPSTWATKYSDWCRTIDDVTVELIGIAAPGISQGVVLASFNAG